jgi:hypothetical protein
MKRSEIINLKIEVAYPNSDIMKNQIIKDNKKKKWSLSLNKSS